MKNKSGSKVEQRSPTSKTTSVFLHGKKLSWVSFGRWSARKRLLSPSHESRKIIIKNKKKQKTKEKHTLTQKQTKEQGWNGAKLCEQRKLSWRFHSRNSSPLHLRALFSAPLQVDFLHVVNVAQSHFPKDAGEEC